MRDPRGYIYFAHQDHDLGRGLTKVGWAYRPVSRVAGLQTANPYALRLVGYFPGTRTMEAHAHRQLSFCHVRGEWFELGSRVALVKAQFAIGTRTERVSKSWFRP